MKLAIEFLLRVEDYRRRDVEKLYMVACNSDEKEVGRPAYSDFGVIECTSAIIPQVMNYFING